MKKFLQNKYSLLVLVLFGFVIIFQNIKQPPEAILTYDVLGYYLYLPGVFIYDQVEFTDRTTISELNETYRLTSSLYQFTVAPNGNLLIRYPVGLAILYLPFFLLAHFIALWYGFPMDGFSPAYHFTMLACGIFYSLLGLYYVRKILLRFFPDWKTALILFFLVFATNYIYKAIFKGIAPHNMLFAVYALIIWFTIRWHETLRIKHALLIGFFCGVAILSRPSEIVCLLIPMFWNVKSRESFIEKLKLFRKHYLHLLGVALIMFLVAMPQLIYWKVTTGKFLFYSYNNPAEGFEFLWPYTLKVLFSFRKGWLIYTPAMIFGIIGFYYLYRYNRPIFIPLFLFFIFNLWFVSAWSNWWYAESYGQRALVQSYAVMAIPFGYFFHGIFRMRKKWITGTVLTISVLFLVLNIFQIWQIKHGILDASRMTREYYVAIFGRTSVTDKQKDLLLVDRSSTTTEFFTNMDDYERKLTFHQDYEVPETGIENHYSREPVHTGSFSFRMDSNMIYSPGYNLTFKNITDREYAWLRISVYIYPTSEISENDALLVVTFGNKDGYYKYRTIHLSDPLVQAQPGQWNKISLDYMTPEVRSGKDKFSAYVWYWGKDDLYVDDLRIEVFEKKTD